MATDDAIVYVAPFFVGSRPTPVYYNIMTISHVHPKKLLTRSYGHVQPDSTSYSSITCNPT